MSALTTTIQLKLNAILSSTLDLGGPVQYPVQQVNTITLADGTGSNQARKIFTDTRTIAASSSESLDLAGSLVDALGATLTFLTIKAIIIKASAANTNNVMVGGAASNAFIEWVSDATDVVVVKPGGMLALVAPGTGYTVTAATGDLLKIANSSSGTGVDYDIILIGT